MDEFSAPADEKFAGLVAGDEQLAPLPAPEPLEDPLTEDEQAEARARQRDRDQLARRVQEMAPPPQAPPEQPPEQSQSPITDRSLLSLLQADQVNLTHKVEHLHNEVARARQATQMQLVVTMAVIAVAILIVYKKRSADA